MATLNDGIQLSVSNHVMVLVILSHWTSKQLPFLKMELCAKCFKTFLPKIPLEY